MYYIDKLGIYHFGQWVVPNFVMAASNHIVAAIQGAGNTMTPAWDSELIYLSDLSSQRKQARFAYSQLSNAVWLAGSWDTWHSRCLAIYNSWTPCSIKQGIALRARGYDNLLWKMVNARSRPIVVLLLTPLKCSTVHLLPTTLSQQ